MLLKNRLLSLLSTLPLLLAACSQPQTATPTADPYADGADYPWFYTAPPGRLTTLSLTPGVNTLYYEPILAAQNGWGPIEIDHSNGEQRAGDGRTLTLNGKTYAKGFGTHAYSELRYSLQGTGATCTRFTVDIGVDDEVGNKGSVAFQVYLDGVKAYDSGRMTGASATKSVSVDISGKRELRLVVTDAGDGKNYDHADWASPKVYCQSGAAPSLTLDRDSLTVFHKHSATLRATFANLSGPVDLSLERGEAGRGLDLQLVPTRVNLSGSGQETRDVTIGAPNDLSNNPDDLAAPYVLVARSGGAVVGRAPLTIEVKPLKITARFEPGSLSGRDGETKQTTVVVTVDPPLESPVPLKVSFGNTGFDQNESSFTRIIGVGPTRGTGAELRADATFLFFKREGLPDDEPARTLPLIVYVGDIVGYRTPGYGTLFVPLELRLIQ